MIQIATCVPKQEHTREAKLAWLDCALRHNPCDLFISPQEFFGGVVPMPDDRHIERSWVLGEVGALARSHSCYIGVGAATMLESGGAVEDFFYLTPSGSLAGHHRKFALPGYDDVRAGGSGSLWPEVSFSNRAKLIELPELNLKVGTIFCWEVFSLAMWTAYSYAGVNLIVHPIKFAPEAWPKVSKENGSQKVTGFARATDSRHLWERRLVDASLQIVFCPIAVSCNSWSLGAKFEAWTGIVDEIQGRTSITKVPSIPEADVVQVHQVDPLLYGDVLDNLHSAGAFVAHVGTIEHFRDFEEWKMHAKVRRLEAQLIGGTTRMDCTLKASTAGRQKKSTRARFDKRSKEQ